MESKNFVKVKNYYDKGLWKEARVKEAAAKGWITEEESNTILGIVAEPVVKATRGRRKKLTTQ